MKRIHCIGNIIMDVLAGPFPHMPTPGKGGTVRAPGIEFLPGGGAANTCIAAAQLGAPIKPFAKIGGDHNGRYLLEVLENHGIDLSGVLISEDEQTGYAYLARQEGGEVAFFHSPGTNYSFCRDDLDLDKLLDCDILLYQDMSSMPALEPDGIVEVLSGAKTKGVLVVADENNIKDAALLDATLPFIDIFKPNYETLSKRLNVESPEELITAVRAKGVSTVVVTLGAEGCIYNNPDGSISHQPSLATKVVDTTGAGDCFNAGLLAGLARGDDLAASIRLASAVSAACLANVGGAVGIPHLAELTSNLS